MNHSLPSTQKFFMDYLLILNIFASFFLCGLIWTIQVVHYPYFLFTGQKEFPDAMAFHRGRISILVVPVMITEIVTSAWLSFHASLFTPLHVAGLIIVLLIWVITFSIQVPLHAKLSAQTSRSLVQSLVRSNRWRTTLWTVKSALGIWLLKLII